MGEEDDRQQHCQIMQSALLTTPLCCLELQDTVLPGMVSFVGIPSPLGAGKTDDLCGQAYHPIESAAQDLRPNKKHLYDRSNAGTVDTYAGWLEACRN